MECRSVREMADSFLAGELLTETNHEMLCHLDACPVCRADVAARRMVRDGVRRAVQNAGSLAPRPEFMEALRVTLRSEAGQLGAHRRVRLHRWGALAATVLLATTIGLVYGGRDWITGTDLLARAAVGDHRNCALRFRLSERPISLADAAERYGAWYRVLERVPPEDIPTAAGPARVLERHACVYQGRRFAHIVLQYRNARVSLVATAVDGDNRYGSAADAVVAAANPVDGMSVVSVRTSQGAVFLVGDVAAADLKALADAVADTLRAGLASA